MVSFGLWLLIRRVLTTMSFVVERDCFGGITIGSAKNRNLSPNLKQTLKDHLETWKGEGVRGVWVTVDDAREDSDWISAAVQLGFDFHHARGKQAVLCKWLPTKEPNNLPVYPFTSIGVGGLVVNQKKEILLMKEKRGGLSRWKFPGGMADMGEDLLEAGEREVVEETGVRVTGKWLLCFRQMHAFKWPECSDLYFVCIMEPASETDQEPAPCPFEAADCRWFSVAELEALSEEEFSPFSRRMLKLHQDCLRNSICLKKETIHSGERSWKVFTITDMSQ